MEGLSVSSQSANQSMVQVNVEAGLQDGGGASQWSTYCKEDLMRGGEELSFEELRAERYYQQKEKEIEEKMRHLKQQKEELSQELEEKKSLLLKKSQEISNVDQPAAAPFKILDESGSEEFAGKSDPSSDELPDDVFLRPDEKGLCVRVQFPTKPNQNQQQNRPPDQAGGSYVFGLISGQPSWTKRDLRAEPDLRAELDLRAEPDLGSQENVSQPKKQLSPIEEISVEAASLPSPGELSGGNSSPLDQNQEQHQDLEKNQEQNQYKEQNQEQNQYKEQNRYKEQNQDQNQHKEQNQEQNRHNEQNQEQNRYKEQNQEQNRHKEQNQEQNQYKEQNQEQNRHKEQNQEQNRYKEQNQEDLSRSHAVDPCDPEVRRQLLDIFDITSSPNVHPEQRPLPAVEACSVLDLGGDTFFIRSRLLDRDSISIFRAAAENQSVFIKVERCSAPWDFYLFTRLKENLPSADRAALISCFLFEDGCVTVYRLPADHQLTVLADCGPDPACVGVKAVRLLELVLQLHRCSLLHAGLRPGILASCGAAASRDWLFPLDWSSSLDLDLQKDVRSVQQVPSAQAYLRLGLLQPADPPHTVDLVGVAETIYFLLTNSEMKPEKLGSSWTVEHDVFTSTWRKFFCSLLNAGGRSSVSVLSELKDELSKLYL